MNESEPTGWVTPERLAEHPAMVAAGIGVPQIKYLARERHKNGLAEKGVIQRYGRRLLINVERLRQDMDERAFSRP